MKQGKNNASICMLIYTHFHAVMYLDFYQANQLHYLNVRKQIRLGLNDDNAYDNNFLNT
jgi:hypothetical protein